MMNLQQRYTSEIRGELQKKLKKSNPIAVPTISKIIVNMGVNGALVDKKNMTNALSILTQITGQKPRVAKAKKAIAAFKLRQGDAIGAVVTLRGARMYDFFEKLVTIVFPRIRDFRGVSKKAFDGRGNYTLGFTEHIVFPEIDPGKVDKIYGLEVCIVTTAKSDADGAALFEALGVPFEKESK
ncbi:MAG: 50S ribosomal protein L5 [Candidatus Levybacteria bacterium]|nr:50S ribosomal protein L5 [Candidatus Levybacteria bacterium]